MHFIIDKLIESFSIIYIYGDNDYCCVDDDDSEDNNLTLLAFSLWQNSFGFFMIHVTVRGTAVKVDKCIMYICNFVCKLDTLKCKVNRAIIIIMVKMKSVHFNPNNKKTRIF